MAASFGANNSSTTTIFRRDQMTGLWSNQTLGSNQVSLIDIKSNGSACSLIGIAYTIPNSGSSYGNTFFQTGSWSNLAQFPGVGGPTLVTTKGTSPQAAMFSWLVPGSPDDMYLTADLYAGSSVGLEFVALRADVTYVPHCK